MLRPGFLRMQPKEAAGRCSKGQGYGRSEATRGASVHKTRDAKMQFPNLSANRNFGPATPACGYPSTFDDLPLGGDQLTDSLPGEGQHLRQVLLAKGIFLAGSLHFDKAPVVSHHHVHVDGG